MSKGHHHLDKRADQLADSISIGGQSEELLRTEKAAQELGVSPAFLVIGRSRGYGPAFIRLGPSVVRYRRSDIVTWLNERLYHSTSEYAEKPRCGRPRRVKENATD